GRAHPASPRQRPAGGRRTPDRDDQRLHRVGQRARHRRRAAATGERARRRGAAATPQARSRRAALPDPHHRGQDAHRRGPGCPGSRARFLTLTRAPTGAGARGVPAQRPPLARRLPRMLLLRSFSSSAAATNSITEMLLWTQNSLISRWSPLGIRVASWIRTSSSLGIGATLLAHLRARGVI